MQATYLKHALPAVLAFEGGYDNNPNDSGGATNFGIIQREYDAHRRACGEPTQSVKLISQAEVDNIYRNNYWVPIHGDDLPYPIDWITFDAAVNMGPGTAIHLLTVAVDETTKGNIPDSHAVTPALLAAVKTECATMTGTHSLKVAELNDRIVRYHEIVDAHAKDAVFLKGWLNRVAELAQES